MYLLVKEGKSITSLFLFNDANFSGTFLGPERKSVSSNAGDSVPSLVGDLRSHGSEAATLKINDYGPVLRNQRKPVCTAK